jgi:protein TonB
LKTQQSTIKRYLPFVFLVIAIHVALVVWILHSSTRVLNSDLQEVITVSLNLGGHRSQNQNQLNIPTLRSSHRVANSIVPTTSKATQGEGEKQTAADSGSSSKQSDLGLGGRSVFFKPKPPYPLASRRMGEQGAVHLQLCVGALGFVESVKLTQSSGYQNLDRSAIETVKAWKFSALSAVSEKISECYQLPIHFQLES